MVSYLNLVKKADAVPYPHEKSYNEFMKNVFILVSHDGSFQLGYLLKLVVDELSNFPQYFTISNENRTVQFNFSLHTIELRESALSAIGSSWKAKKLFSTLNGWRDELYIVFDPLQNPYFRLERAMCPLLGVVMYGAHINGYVELPNGELKIWVPRRAANKATYPGMLDNTVAGGLGYPYGPLQTVYKECYEEAGLDEEYLKKGNKVRSCGAVSYFYQLKPMEFNSELGLIQPEVEYIYDIKMEIDKIPHPVDNEAEDFQLMSIDEIKIRLQNGEFKDNCGAIIIDFLIRHSIMTAEDESNFLEMNSRLHRMLPFPIRGN